MSRPVTLFTGQFADIPLEDLAKAAAWGYDGLELACWGDHVDVARAAKSKAYARSRKEILAKYGLKLYAISNHLAGQLVCDPNDDARSDMFAPPSCKGKAEAKRKWAIQAMKNTARAAENIGVKVVNGFTGSSIWHMLYSFPPVSDEHDRGRLRALRQAAGTRSSTSSTSAACKFALEVHPDRDRLRHRHRPTRAQGASRTARRSGSTSTPATCTGRWSIRCKFLNAFPDRIYHVT